jgi:hypothetical protein
MSQTIRLDSTKHLIKLICIIPASDCHGQRQIFALVKLEIFFACTSIANWIFIESIYLAEDIALYCLPSLENESLAHEIIDL